MGVVRYLFQMQCCLIAALYTVLQCMAADDFFPFGQSTFMQLYNMVLNKQFSGYGHDGTATLSVIHMGIDPGGLTCWETYPDVCVESEGDWSFSA